MIDVINKHLKEFKARWYSFDHMEYESKSYPQKAESEKLKFAYGSICHALYDIENNFLDYKKEKDDYIARLEAQISRDRESLIREGEKSEVLKKYLGNQKEWIND